MTDGDCSLRREFTGRCRRCGTLSTIDAWEVIDGDHRPDLLAAAAADHLNVLTCPACGAEAVADAAVAIWRRHAIPPLLLVPSSQGPGADSQVLERLSVRMAEVGATLTTKRAVLTPPSALALALATDDRDDTAEPDEWQAFYLQKVDEWIEMNEVDRDIAALLTAATWGDLAAVIRSRQGLVDRPTIAELDSIRQEAAGDGQDAVARQTAEYLAVLRECVRLGVDEAMAAHPPDEPLGPMAQRSQLWDEIEDLDASTSSAELAELLRRLLDLIDPDEEPVMWRKVAGALATALADLRDGDIAGHIEEALRLYDGMLATLGCLEADPEAWAAIRNDQAIAYRRRLLGARSEQIDKAVGCYEEALAIHEARGSEAKAAQTRVNIAVALLERPGDQRVQDRARAIELLEGALPTLLASPGASVAAGHLALANAYLKRDQAGDDERAGASYRAAAAAYDAEGDPQRAALLRIAAANADTGSDDPASVQRVVCSLQDALRIVTREAAPRDWARAHMGLASAYQRVGQVDEQILALRTSLEVCTPDTFPVDCIEAATWLGNTLTLRASTSPRGETQDWSDAAGAYELALEAAERLYERPGDERHRDNELIERGDLHHRAALALSRAGRGIEASAVLEAGRARRLMRLLKGDEIVTPADRPAAVATDAAAAIVYLVVTPAGTEALILVGHDGATGEVVESVALDAFSHERLFDLLARRTASGGARGYLIGQELGGGALRAALRRLLPVLGEDLMLPIATRLGRLGVDRVVLVPTGPFATLPLHAASYVRDGRRRELFDELTVSYAPSAGALAVARRRAHAADDRPAALVGLAGAHPSRAPMPYALAELDAAARYFGDSRSLVGEEADRSTLLAELPGATHVLLACHGAYEMSDPLGSHIDLPSGDRIEVRELLGERAFDGVRLLMASACQSAVASTTRLPDEHLGLTSAFLAAGAASVLGTLWPVYDLTTALLVDAFTRFHREGDVERGLPPQPPAQALALAQRWLRDVRAGTLAEHFAGQADSSGAGETPGGLRLRLSPMQTIEAAAYFSYLDPGSQPYLDEPITWAGFVLVGAG